MATGGKRLGDRGSTDTQGAQAHPDISRVPVEGGIYAPPAPESSAFSRPARGPAGLRRIADPRAHATLPAPAPETGMTAILFVAVATALALVSALLLFLRRWRIAALLVLILAFMAIGAEGPRAVAELAGQRLPGIVAATRETLRLESMRATGQRSTHYNPKHRFGAIVCYRALGAPGLGAATLPDPAVLAAIGEVPGEADRLCRTAPGQGILRQAEVKLDEATHDSTTAGQPVMLHVLRPFGLLEWAWTTDAPLLPWLARPRWGGGAETTLSAQVVSITIDQRGRGLLSRRAQDYAVPIAHVRLRYAPPGHPAGVEGVDAVDAPSVTHLAPGSRVQAVVTADAPRSPRLASATRKYWWRNHVLEAATALALLAGLAALVVALRRRRRPR